MTNPEMTPIQTLRARLSSMSPLEEEDVEEFEEALVALFEAGTLEAALVVFDALDDRCDLGGVMQTATGVLSEFPPETVIQTLMKRLPDGARHRRDTISDLLRPMLLSEVDRKLFRLAYQAASQDTREILREILQVVGRSQTYGPAAFEVLDEKGANAERE